MEASFQEVHYSLGCPIFGNLTVHSVQYFATGEKVLDFGSVILVHPAQMFINTYLHTDAVLVQTHSKDT